MIFQNIEFYETAKYQYLLIHKNASTSVLNFVCKDNYFITKNKNINKVKWTVIRDPFERFVSGLVYDLKRNNLKIEDINFNKLFTSKINEKTRKFGSVNHTCLQTLYLINSDIDWYIDINDLNVFLKMHFNESICLNKFKDHNLTIDKKEIMKYLTIDYEIYNQVMYSDYLWEWQKGKIF